MLIRIFLVIVICFCGLISSAAAQESKNSTTDSLPLKLINKPKTSYTDSARQKNVEGWVRLKVTFLATGEVGEVVFVKDSSKKKKLTKYGLVDQAIEAAKSIKFEPARENGQPVTVTKTVEYTFTLY